MNPFVIVYFFAMHYRKKFLPVLSLINIIVNAKGMYSNISLVRLGIY